MLLPACALSPWCSRTIMSHSPLTCLVVAAACTMPCRWCALRWSFARTPDERGLNMLANCRARMTPRSPVKSTRTHLGLQTK
jgi:hypothetical protein